MKSENNNFPELSFREKFIQLKQILERNCKEITKSESLQFPSLFSRLVYITQKYSLPNALERQLHNIRVKYSSLMKDKEMQITESEYAQASDNLNLFLSFIHGNKSIEKVSETEIREKNKVGNNLEKKDYLRVQVLEIDSDNQIIVGKVNNEESAVIQIKYNVNKINDAFNPTIEKLWVNAQINIIDFSITSSGIYIPKYIVLEPDYLIDASALAECFQNYGKSYLHYFRKRFERIPNSQHILLGNLANFFLDDFIFSDDPEQLDFNKTFLESFKQKPFEFTSCNDIKQSSDFRSFMVKARTQFDNIKRVIIHDLATNNIDRDRCILEPSFYSEKFGFQGRLDLFQYSETSDPHQIIELKSGGLPYPKTDSGKISINHEVQTAIYRLIINSVYGSENKKVTSAILYSAAENSGENLRYAASFQILEKEILNLRNLIVATEHNLYLGGVESVEKLFSDILNLDNYGRVPQFFIDQINDFGKVINRLTELEKIYLYRFISFIARELYILKVGDEHYESNSSVARLWNTEFEERLDTFDLISDLNIINIDDSGRDLKIKFNRNKTSDFINFREGELCILYPKDNQEDTALTNQILKGTLVEISKDYISLRFRYKQKNRLFFEKYNTWVIEHDRLDHNYVNMYKSLFDFFKTPYDKREILFGLKEPQSQYVESYDPQTIEEKQDSIINKAIAAGDYFLIVGPPGTGKTSIFARRLIEHYYNNTEDNILIIAYTNKAVDELCEAINQAFNCNDKECDSYIRIGTELSCGEDYRHRLLQNIADSVSSREELRNIIQRQRIFIGTLASITGKPELFDLKKFNISIIDEASQILEPQIMGLLTHFDKFIMIGDHKQLSTITLQNSEKSKISESELNIIKLYSCCESLFERLFRISQTNKWELAYDTLVYQGRMHEEIANFPNKYFYNSMLRPVNDWQNENLCLNIGRSNNIYQKIVSEHRLMFINVTGSNDTLSDKVNYKEAEIVSELSKAIINLYSANNLDFDPQKSLGIITPYRNQIALIKHKLKEAGISELENIMVDTVERYQGSQRDIIIFSFCINKPYQLDFFSNLNEDQTVDKKLNVALTRARQQLFLVGNEYILRQNEIYNNLINSIPNSIL